MRINAGTVSAYGIAKKNGFVGTEAQWLESLHAIDPDILEDIRQAKETAGEALQRVGSLEVEVGDASILLSLI